MTNNNNTNNTNIINSNNINTTPITPSTSIRNIEYKTLVYDPNAKRNVVDHLKWLSDEDVITELSKQQNNFSLLLLNIDYDNNTGNIIRSANAFGAREVILYGRKKFDRRASVGVEFYMKFRQVKYLEDLDEIFSSYDTVVALENNVKDIPTSLLSDFRWNYNKRTLICIGQEGTGLPQEILQRCHHCLEIQQIGSVRSLNVAVASGIVMYDYCSKKTE
jgi:tRNA G18 (ribose-2'-O)-methylase SpoU